MICRASLESLGFLAPLEVLNRFADALLFGMTQVLLFALGVGRYHQYDLSGWGVVVNRSHASPLALALAAPARFADPAGTRDDRVGFRRAGDRSFHRRALVRAQQPLHVSLVAVGDDDRRTHYLTIREPRSGVNRRERESLHPEVVYQSTGNLQGHLAAQNPLGRFDVELAKTHETAEDMLRQGDTPMARAWIGYICGVSGQTQRARESLVRFNSLTRTLREGASTEAIVHAGLRDRPRVLELLEQGLEQHSVDMVYIKALPMFWPALESEPRFQKLVQRMGLPLGEQKPGTVAAR